MAGACDACVAGATLAATVVFGGMDAFGRLLSALGGGCCARSVGGTRATTVTNARILALASMVKRNR